MNSLFHIWALLLKLPPPLDPVPLQKEHSQVQSDQIYNLTTLQWFSVTFMFKNIFDLSALSSLSTASFPLCNGLLHPFKFPLLSSPRAQGPWLKKIKPHFWFSPWSYVIHVDGLLSISISSSGLWRTGPCFLVNQLKHLMSDQNSQRPPMLCAHYTSTPEWMLGPEWVASNLTTQWLGPTVPYDRGDWGTRLISSKMVTHLWATYIIPSQHNAPLCQTLVIILFSIHLLDECLPPSSDPGMAAPRIQFITIFLAPDTQICT